MKTELTPLFVKGMIALGLFFIALAIWTGDGRMVP